MFLAVINLILCTQRMPCENSMKTCIGSILAVSILVLEVRLSCILLISPATECFTALPACSAMPLRLVCLLRPQGGLSVPVLPVCKVRSISQIWRSGVQLGRAACLCCTLDPAKLLRDEVIGVKNTSLQF